MNDGNLSEMTAKEMTVILPCAGEGVRLGLDSPKELLEILPGTRLIDFSLAHIRAALENGVKLTVAVVSRPWKTMVPEYVAERLPGVRVETVMFNDDYHEWPGSVFSAREMFSLYNMVLLPDSFLSFGTGFRKQQTVNGDNRTAAELMMDKLKRFPAVFGHIPCSEPTILKNLGALAVNGGKIEKFQDKPCTDLHLYNSFWGCYGFRRRMGEPLYRFLLSSVTRDPRPLPDLGTFPLSTYRDLGTWEHINHFRINIKKS